MFLGHVTDVVDNGYKPLQQFQNKKVLVKENEKYSLVSNICPHQKSLISTKAHFGNRMCPYHNWTFEVSGQPIASGRTSSYCKNTTPLEVNEVYHYHGLLFDTTISFPIIKDFKNLKLIEERMDIVKANPENIMDLFLDVDHIQCVHPGVYDKVGIDNINVEWTYYDNGSIQMVKQGACWIALYPYTMIEWQQGMLFVTIAEKVNKNKSKVYIFKYRDMTLPLSDWLINETVWETAWHQDKTQAELITEFTETNIEPSKHHYRQWLKNGFNT
jgi:phenylpropionate dioxygenase-like ring-hydroxylating dioxygenase large terminal subunit